MEDKSEKPQNKIPSMEIDAKNRIVEQTKKVPLVINGKEILITLKKIHTGVRNKIREECTDVKVLGGQPQIKVNQSDLQEKILSKAIIDAPFEISIDGIKKLPPEVSDYLQEEYDNFAEPTQKKNSESEEA